MKKIILVAMCVTQIACTTPVRMSADDLSRFQVDCNRRQEQYNFLESQKYSDNDRFNLALQMTSALGIVSNIYRGTADDSSAAMRGEHEAMIRAQQRQLRQRCLLEDSFKKQQ